MAAAEAQVNLLLDNELVYDKERWGEWLRKTGISNLAIEDYYLKPSRQNKIGFRLYTDSEREFVLKELFSDAVACGALRFKDPVDAKDFRLRVDDEHWIADILIIEYAPNGEVLATKEAPFGPYEHRFHPAYRAAREKNGRTLVYASWCVKPKVKLRSINKLFQYMQRAINDDERRSIGAPRR